MVDVCAQWFLVHFVPILSINIYNNVSWRVSHTIVNSLNTHKLVIQCLDVCVQVWVCSSV